MVARTISPEFELAPDYTRSYFNIIQVLNVDRVAKDVKEAKDSNRSLVLNDGLHKVATRVSGGKFRIPTNPAMVASGLSVEVGNVTSENPFLNLV